jgi:putative addiction module antidote
METKYSAREAVTQWALDGLGFGGLLYRPLLCDDVSLDQPLSLLNDRPRGPQGLASSVSRWRSLLSLRREVAIEAGFRHYDGYKYAKGASMNALKLSRVGTSTGMIIPKEMLTRMRVKKGDTLYAIETAEGYLLTPYDPSIDKQLKAGRQFMKNNRDTFKALAK